MTYKPISDYGVIGDTHSAALVGKDGSIDWACFPRFDSASVFAAILDDAKGGRFSIRPSGASESQQRYLPDTNILATTFATDTGEVELLDFMPPRNGSTRTGPPHQIHRQVRCLAGLMELDWLFQPRFDYARAKTAMSRRPYGVLATAGDESVALSTDAPLANDGDTSQGRLRLLRGEAATFVLAYGRQNVLPVEKFQSAQALELTKRHWQDVTEHIEYEGPWRDDVVRSFLLLHLLIYEPTGAVVAAPTTSLPEEIGGERNWDYRYGWLRDSAFTMDILYRLGDRNEGKKFFNWLVDECHATIERTRIVYGIDRTTDLRERSLTHLEGYRGSQPVRVGNGAANMLQMDVFGEVILSIDTYHKQGGKIDERAWEIVESFARQVSKDWKKPDRGVWEIRGRAHHFVYSKVMCWAALDRAAGMARALRRGRPDEVAEWERTADTIKAEVLTKGWSEEKQAFRQAYDNDDMDAANLVIPFVGFLAGDDPRVVSTVRRIRDELSQGALVHRYDNDTGVDGLSGGEGAFVMLSFWLIGALLSAGEVEEAKTLFEEILGYSNHLGLFSEMVDLETRETLGNFPQAFSHIGLLHTARNLTVALNGNAPV